MQRKSPYETPATKLIFLSNRDIITTSNNRDENQGAWDPQNYIFGGTNS